MRNSSAACADPRLPSIQPGELDSLEISISVVSAIDRVFPSSWEELSRAFEHGHHGILVVTRSGRAAQLPVMWTKYSTSEEFVAVVAKKVALSSAREVGDAAWYRFEVTNY